MSKAIFRPDDIENIGTYADNIPKRLLRYTPGEDNWPTVFAVDDKDGKIYAYVGKKDKYTFSELGSMPMLRDERQWILDHGQDVTEQINELLAVSEFHASRTDDSRA